MNDQFEAQENRIRQLADSFVYPATPDVAADVRKRLTVTHGRQPKRMIRLAWAAALLLVLLFSLLAVPAVRAAVWRIFNIGAITIFELEGNEEFVVETAVLSATKPEPLVPIVALGLAEEVTRAEAIAEVDSFYLPSPASGLGDPDRIYFHAQDGVAEETVISIWDEATSEQASTLALYQIEVGQYAYKGSKIIAETTVNDQWAIWVEGAHFFRLQDGRWQEWQFVESNVLIVWHDAGLTFRLEGADSLAEAVRIMESLTKVED